MLPRELVEKLRKEATKGERSYHQICIAAGVDRQALTTWVGKTKNPSLVNFIAVANELGFEVELVEKRL